MSAPAPGDAVSPPDPPSPAPPPGPPSAPTPGDAPQPGTKSVQTAAAWLFKDVSGALLWMGILAYGLLRLAYEKFYDTFGVSLNELGIGYVQLLSQGAVGLTVLFLFSGLM